MAILDIEVISMQEERLQQAVAWLREADGLLITAGAGMGVDSGLPDFRGNEGLWRAYPALAEAGCDFQSIANPRAFMDKPELAWGFYGHRLKLYREVEPHPGFAILRRWGDRLRQGAFVFTSNVDGQFQRAGFAESRIEECHGSIHYLQCTEPCFSLIESATDFVPSIDERECRCIGPLPRCKRCGAISRPNILMFWDSAWLSSRADAQAARLAGWLRTVERLVVVEVGAGTALPTVRRFSERHGPRVIRINAREAQIDPARGVGIEGRAVEILTAIDSGLDV
ncbi:sir2 family protein [Paraburkholderia xenovorans LB400]|uniref:protein acetyllysine N-acetyltransferase n=1 Tax=Paraburkholderia xenovorans (strain LB400) TaxID=266265 RepID=Q13RU3_PARXL|nr:Silent information regulator protein Sir2 [Paraburkholderia xenovorans LB400]AIP37618.1 sir2 family protein [Paraburkholderia xenovorans LB400]